MTSLYLKTSVLVRPRENDNPAFLKNPTLGNVFKNLHFGARNLCLRLDGKLERRKISVTVRNIRIRVEGAYREPSPSARKIHKRKKEISYLLGVHQVYVTCKDQDTCYSRQTLQWQIRNISKPRFLTYLSRLNFRCFISTFSAMSSTKDLTKRLS